MMDPWAIWKIVAVTRYLNRVTCLYACLIVF